MTESRKCIYSLIYCLSLPLECKLQGEFFFLPPHIYYCELELQNQVSFNHLLEKIKLHIIFLSVQVMWQRGKISNTNNKNLPSIYFYFNQVFTKVSFFHIYLCGFISAVLSLVVKVLSRV